MESEIVIIDLSLIDLPDAPVTQEMLDFAVDSWKIGTDAPLVVMEKGNRYLCELESAAGVIVRRWENQITARCYVREAPVDSSSIQELCDQKRIDLPSNALRRRFDALLKNAHNEEDIVEAFDRIYQEEEFDLKAHFLIFELDKSEMIIVKFSSTKQFTKLKKALHGIKDRGVTVDSVIAKLLCSPHLPEWIEKKRKGLEAISGIGSQEA